MLLATAAAPLVRREQSTRHERRWKSRWARRGLVSRPPFVTCYPSYKPGPAPWRGNLSSPTRSRGSQAVDHMIRMLFLGVTCQLFMITCDARMAAYSRPGQSSPEKDSTSSSCPIIATSSPCLLPFPFCLIV